MNWHVVFSPHAGKELSKLSVEVRGRILGFIEERLATADDPRLIGAALTGPLRNHWKYRVGDYRIVARIEDRIVTIVVLRIGHRREVYR